MLRLCWWCRVCPRSGRLKDVGPPMDMQAVFVMWWDLPIDIQAVFVMGWDLPMDIQASLVIWWDLPIDIQAVLMISLVPSSHRYPGYFEDIVRSVDGYEDFFDDVVTYCHCQYMLWVLQTVWDSGNVGIAICRCFAGVDGVLSWRIDGQISALLRENLTSIKFG